MVAGEIDMNDSWHSYKTFNNKKFWLDPRSELGWNYWYDWDVTPAWRLAADQYNYFKDPNNGFINENVITIDNIDDIAKNATSGLIQTGDLMYFADCDAEDPHHATMISKVDNGEIYFTGHTSSRFDRELSKSMDGQKVYIIPIRDDA